jgi:hypothetical protein
MTEEQAKNAPDQLQSEPVGRAKGGKARAEALTPDERREIARKGALARWGDKATDLPRAAYIGTLTIADMSFPCSVLSDGTRILTQSDFMTGMGMYYSGWVAKNRPVEDVSADMPHFLSFSTLKPFVNKHLGDLQSIAVKYRTVGGQMAHGIRAEIIPKICEIWLDADEKAALGVRQKKIAAKAKILMRGLAHVGIIAMVDEATGYQEVRDKKALEAILDRFLRKEFAAWAKRFPDEFYQEMFRLRGWEWNGLKVHRPSVVGKYTNDLVYERLAPNILEELEKKNPKNEKGNRVRRHHQWLTEDIGHPALAQHLYATIGFMRASMTWDEFYRMMQRAFPKKNTTMLLPMPDPS